MLNTLSNDSGGSNSWGLGWKFPAPPSKLLEESVLSLLDSVVVELSILEIEVDVVELVDTVVVVFGFVSVVNF